MVTWRAGVVSVAVGAVSDNSTVAARHKKGQARERSRAWLSGLAESASLAVRCHVHEDFTAMVAFERMPVLLERLHPTCRLLPESVGLCAVLPEADCRVRAILLSDG